MKRFEINIIILIFFLALSKLFADDKPHAIQNFDTTDVPFDLVVPIDFSVDSTSGDVQFQLNWDSNFESLKYKIYKKMLSDNRMGDPIKTINDTSTTSFTDSDVQAGVIYDYGVEDYRFRYSSYGYIAGGVKIPPVHNKGKILVLIDETIADELDSLLNIFRYNLIGDGWKPVFKYVPRTEEFNALQVRKNKDIIINEYIKPDSLRSILLFGRIAVPYSGYFSIDGHSDHYGAWSADTYYADLDGIWTDTASVDTSAKDPRNHNYPGDGKYDNYSIPTNAELEFGRVDFFNLPAFEESEIELYKRYLIKNNNWRNNLVPFPKNAGIVNYFPVHELNESPSSNAWQNLSSLMNLDSIKEYDDREILHDKDFLWYWGSGPGSYNSSYKCLYTDELATTPHNAVFTCVFGSYNGDWDSEDNVLRAAIASEPSILTCAWAGRPFWQFIHMGLGKHIGYSVKLSLNNFYFSYPSSAKYGSRGVHFSFMGDPTLKMYNLTPVNNLSAVSEGENIRLSWTNEMDYSYYIYRAGSLDDKFILLNENPIKATEFVDENPYYGNYYYLVRPTKLEHTQSGSFYNLGLGKITSYTYFPEEPDKSLDAIVYPNPASSDFNILLYSEENENITVFLYDIAGRKTGNLYSGKINNGWQILNIQDDYLQNKISDGYYYISIKTPTSAKILPFVIQR